MVGSTDRETATRLIHRQPSLTVNLHRRPQHPTFSTRVRSRTAFARPPLAQKSGPPPERTRSGCSARNRRFLATKKAAHSPPEERSRSRERSSLVILKRAFGSFGPRGPSVRSVTKDASRLSNHSSVLPFASSAHGREAPVRMVRGTFGPALLTGTPARSRSGHWLTVSATAPQRATRLPSRLRSSLTSFAVVLIPRAFCAPPARIHRAPTATRFQSSRGISKDVRSPFLLNR